MVIRQLGLIGRLEGISYLLLLGIAMPLKYLAGQPWMVQIVGAAHGGLFIWFCVLLGLAMTRHNMSLSHSNLGFIASLLPFGTFVYEAKILPQYQNK